MVKKNEVLKQGKVRWGKCKDAYDRKSIYGDRTLECEEGGGKRGRAERGGERSQHISLNKKKVESSDHQLVRECLINIVMRPQVCRAK